MKMKNKKRKRYISVIDHKTNTTYEYSKFQWYLAFTLIFIAGIGFGVGLSYYIFI